MAPISPRPRRFGGLFHHFPMKNMLSQAPASRSEGQNGPAPPVAAPDRSLACGVQAWGRMGWVEDAKLAFQHVFAVTPRTCRMPEELAAGAVQLRLFPNLALNADNVDEYFGSDVLQRNNGCAHGHPLCYSRRLPSGADGARPCLRRGRPLLLLRWQNYVAPALARSYRALSTQAQPPPVRRRLLPPTRAQRVRACF